MHNVLTASKMLARGAAAATATGLASAAITMPLSPKMPATVGLGSPVGGDLASEAVCKPIVICGPSGVGKSTLIGLLRKEFPEDFGFSVSHTTRDPRPGEQNGVDYHFVDKETMEKGIAAGNFLEYAYVHGNIYGTSKQAVDRVAKDCKVCILDIDIQGVRTCKSLGFDADAYIFVAPPDMVSLEARLRGRGTETEEKVLKRLRAAVSEVEGAQSIEWDAILVNDDLASTYDKLKLVTARARERCRLARELARRKQQHDSGAALAAATITTPTHRAE